MAAKLEEFQPLSSEEFSKSTKGRYPAEEIRQTEVEICQVRI